MLEVPPKILLICRKIICIELRLCKLTKNRQQTNDLQLLASKPWLIFYSPHNNSAWTISFSHTDSIISSILSWHASSSDEYITNCILRKTNIPLPHLIMNIFHGHAHQSIPSQYWSGAQSRHHDDYRPIITKLHWTRIDTKTRNSCHAKPADWGQQTFLRAFGSSSLSETGLASSLAYPSTSFLILRFSPG